VLEIGTGSGYSGAVLGRLAREVVSVERIAELVEDARSALAEAGTGNVELVLADGSRGHAPGAPYEGIAVHAATPEVPHSLLAQLAPGGRLVAPIATGSSDLLTAFRRDAEGSLSQQTLGPCRFVPLIGAEGFDQG
jgi:protein-L-isoaspartate(D-aspartate) O-methyltransferase